MPLVMHRVKRSQTDYPVRLIRLTGVIGRDSITSNTLRTSSRCDEGGALMTAAPTAGMIGRAVLDI